MVTSSPGLASQRKLEQMPFLAGSSAPFSSSQYVACAPTGAAARLSASVLAAPGRPSAVRLGG